VVSFAGWLMEMPTTETAWETWRTTGREQGWIDGCDDTGRDYLEHRATLLRGVMPSDTGRAGRR
jgi:hypothetical protein